MSSKVKERRFRVPPNFSPDDLASLVHNVASQADFYSVSYQKGKPVVLKTLADADDILEDAIQKPDELYRKVSSLTEIPIRLEHQKQVLVEMVNCLAQSGLRCVAFVVGDLALFEKWTGLRLSATKPKPWESQDAHFYVLNVPGFVDTTLDPSRVVLLAGADDSLTSVNVTRGFFVIMDNPLEAPSYDRPNAGSWSF